MKKVLLVYAGKRSKYPRFPMPCLVLAAWLRKHNYEPKILDLRLDEQSFPTDCFCVCVSSMTGEALESAIYISKFFKKLNVPVIWGGHHISAIQQKEDFIDSMIIGEGEIALLKALKDLENGQLKERYEQELVDMEELPFPAYDLIDISKYVDSTDEFQYEASRGCPGNCSFCYVEYFHHRKWRSKSPNKIIKEIKIIVETYHPKKIKFISDNYFVNKQNVFEVCKGIKDLHIQWASTIRIDYLYRFSDEEMQLLKDSGCWLLALGAESGSQRTLDLINKGITPEQTLGATEKCKKFGILPVLSMMIGLPGEEKKDVLQTLDLYDKLVKLDAEINGVFLFTPYPGTKLYEKAIELGYTPPKTIEEWSKWRFGDRKKPWHRKMGSQLETIAIIVRFKFFVSHINTFTKDYLNKKLHLNLFMKIGYFVGMPLLRMDAFLRWKFRFFRLGIEWKAFQWVLARNTEIY